MLSNSQVYNALDSIRTLVEVDLLPLFDSFSPQYVPSPILVETDWLTLIKSDNYNETIFTDYSQGFIDYCANANNFLALKGDTLAYSRIKASSMGLNIFLTSPCVPLLPIREVSVTAFNAEIMTGKVYIISYKPYVSGTSSSLFWELRKRASGAILKHVLYDVNAGLFNPVGVLMTKEALGNFYSGSNGYNYESTAFIKVLDV